MKHSKTVLVTGGSRGIGAATAKLFAQQGYAVCINYKTNHSAAKDVVSSIKAFGGECFSVQADVSKEADVLDLFSQFDQKYGQLSVLVNNAGILQPQMRLDQMSIERINQILMTNVSSYFLCCKEAVKRMSTQYNGLGGAIVNVSSGAALTGSPNEYIDYAASKGAIDALTRGLAKEVASEKIRVNGVRPGLIYTDMHADGGEAQRVDRLKCNLPLQRGGNPEEVANAIFWLASQDSSFTTGGFIDVTGGL